jgi:hypothetical protein
VGVFALIAPLGALAVALAASVVTAVGVWAAARPSGSSAQRTTAGS